MNDRYYRDSLTADRLRQAYEIAPRRVKQYLIAEVDYVSQQTKSDSVLLEIGCGYGRIMKQLSPAIASVWGIDNAIASLRLGANYLQKQNNCHLVAMNAAQLGFHDRCFDVVICLQNGLSAIKADRRVLLLEAIRACREGGRVVLSSYVEQFWDDRLEWFRRQARLGLLGAIDEAATGNGTIVCRDGFTASTLSAHDFEHLVEAVGQRCEITHVDNSSLMCTITKSPESR